MITKHALHLDECPGAADAGQGPNDAGMVVRYAPLVPAQRPFFGAGLSCAQSNKQALCRRSIGTDSLLEVTDCSHPPKHPAQLSLLAPFEDRRPNHSRDLGEKVHLAQFRVS
jgi:hypothetical protein